MLVLEANGSVSSVGTRRLVMNRIMVLAYFIIYIWWFIKTESIDTFQLLIGFGLLVIINILGSLTSRE